MSTEEKPTRKHNLSGKTEGNKEKKKKNDSLICGRTINYKADNNYKFNEVLLEKNETPLKFSPSFFLRTHSKNNDPADVQTQVSFIDIKLINNVFIILTIY